MKKILISIMMALMAFVLVSCGGGKPEEAEKYKITFKQTGYADVVVEVEVGKTLATEDIPVIQGEGKVGYIIAWDVTDFSTVTGDKTVNAVETPKTYVLRVNADNGTPIENKQVTYDQAYTITRPEKQGYEFDCWRIVGGSKNFDETGTWNYDENITIKAIWRRQEIKVYICGVKLDNISGANSSNMHYEQVNNNDAVYQKVATGDCFKPITFTGLSEEFVCFVDNEGEYVDLYNTPITAVTYVYLHTVAKTADQYVLTFIEQGQGVTSVAVDKDASISDANIPAIVETNYGHNSFWKLKTTGDDIVKFDKATHVNQDLFLVTDFEARMVKITYNLLEDSVIFTDETIAKYGLVKEGNFYVQYIKYLTEFELASEIYDKASTYKLGPEDVTIAERTNCWTIQGTDTFIELSGKCFTYGEDIVLRANLIRMTVGEQSAIDKDFSGNV